MDSKLDNLTQSEIDALKIGDTVLYEFSGFRAGRVFRDKIVKITKTQIVCERSKFTKYGMHLPRDKYINGYLGKVKNVPNS